MVSQQPLLLRSKKQILFVLRLLFFAAATAMAVHERGTRSIPWQFYLVAGLFLATNLGILLERSRVLNTERASGWIFIFDTLVATLLIYYLGVRPTEFYLIYIFAVFISALARNVKTAFAVAFMVSALYAGLTLAGRTQVDLLSFHFLIRFAFLFIVASFVAYLAQEVETERAQRLEAEQKVRAEQETHLKLQMKSQKELAEMAGFYQDILQSIQSGVIVTTPEGRVILFNRRAEELCKISAGQVMAKVLRDIPELTPFQNIVSGQSPSDFQPGRHEIEIPGLNGKPMTMGVHTSALKDADGRVTGFIGVFQDITLIREYERQIMQMERLATVGVLASEIAHEINNPLASIAGCAEALLRRIYETTYSPNTDETQKYLKIIYDESFRCKSILERILGQSRGAPFSTQPVHVQAVIDDVVQLVRSQPLSSQKEIRFQPASDLPRVDGHPAQLKQVFLNLLLNGLDAVEKGGRVEISGGTMGNEVRITFTDNGCGIPHENLHRIFDPFFTTKGQTKGTGLGLSISSDIIRRHKGRLTVSSEGVGRGACFTVCLPCSTDGKDGV